MACVPEWEKCCLLAKDEKAFYIIEVGRNLNWETEEWLMVRGVSEELLKELMLSFTYIPKKDIRGVAFSGCEAGADVYLYLRSEKRKLTLELDYEQAWMDAFFGKLHRFTAPKRKEPGDKGWRKERQDKETFERLKLVAPCFLVLGLVSGIGWLTTQHWILFTCCLVLCAAQLALVLCFPVYFTCFLPKGKREQNVWDLELPMWCTGVWLVFGVSEDWLDFSAFRWIIPMGICVGILIYWRVCDLHNDPWGLLSCLFVCCICTIVITGRANIVYDTSPGESWVLEVEELRSSGGRHRDYYCTVTMPDGAEESLSISRSLYLDLEEGDFVRVERNIGALGMEYSRVHLIE